MEISLSIMVLRNFYHVSSSMVLTYHGTRDTIVLGYHGTTHTMVPKGTMVCDQLLYRGITTQKFLHLST